jgi:hypothetical protein
MGVAFIGDVGGFATRMRKGLQNVQPGVLHRWMPSWTFRAFGVYCIMFAIGELIFFHFQIKPHAWL